MTKPQFKEGDEPIYPVSHNWDDECWLEMRMDYELLPHFNAIEVNAKNYPFADSED